MIRDLRQIKEAGPTNIANVFGIDDAIMLGLGGASLLSGILGQNKQAKLAKEQMAQQNALSQQQLQLASEDQRLAQAGQVDQYGNTLKYDPLTNTWTTQLSSTGQQISDAERNEELRSLQYDAPLARGEAIAAAQRRSQEGDTANALLQQLNDKISGKTAVQPGQLAASIRMARTQAQNAGFRQATKSFNTNAIRTGMSAGAAGDALSAAGKNFADYSAMIAGNPDLEARTTADQMNAGDRGSLVDAYAAMASRATGSPGFQYTPSNQSSTLASALSGAKGSAIQGTTAAGDITGNAAKTLLGGYGSTAGAMVPNYSGAFNQLYNLTQSGAGQDLIGVLTGMYKNRGSDSSKSIQVSDFGNMG